MSVFSSIAYAELTVTADEMSYNDKLKESYAKKNAVAVYKKNNESHQIKADSLTVKHKPNATEENSIEEIDAIGNVFFTNKDFELSAGRCNYNHAQNKIHCYTDVNVLDIKTANKAEGDECVIDIDKSTYTIKGNNNKKAETTIKTK